MQKLILRTAPYQYLETGFKEWLDILGYNHMTVYNMPHIIREFLHFLEQKDITSIHTLQHSHIRSYHDHISRRSNQKRGGGLSSKYIHMQMQAIEKFLSTCTTGAYKTCHRPLLN